MTDNNRDKILKLIGKDYKMQSGDIQINLGHFLDRVSFIIDELSIQGDAIQMIFESASQTECEENSDENLFD